MKTNITIETSIYNVPGRRAASQIVEGIDDTMDLVEVALDVHAYNSHATEPGEGPLLDLELSWSGEAREKTEERPYGGAHCIEVSAVFNQTQAKALRDQINAFLELE
ncbi:MAG TPA: hypothetical protein VGG68_14970 [Caulobacteraceae bacterium]|jgi:hypothetical protein